MFAAARLSYTATESQREKDAVLVKAFLKGTHWIMQRSNNDTITRNLHTELHHSIENEGNNEDEPEDLNYLISWFNFKRFRTGHGSQRLKSANTLMKLLSQEFCNGFCYTCS